MNVTAPKVYVVTLNWNGASDTIACAESLRGLQHPCCAFVICDNASRPDDLARLRAWGATLPGGLPEIDAEAIAPVVPGSAPQHEGQFVLVHTGANRGYAGGMNAGLRHALAQGDADYAWVTRLLMDLAWRHCRGRVISCLEGGYVLNPLARSAAAHIKVLIGAD